MSSIIISSDYVAEVEALVRDGGGGRKIQTIDALERVPVSDDEMISLLRTLQANGPDRPRWTLGVISSLPGEGVSTIARGLARIVARNPKAKVLICNVPTDTDSRRSDFYGYGQDGYRPGQLDFTWLPGSQVAVGSFGEPGFMAALASDLPAVSAMVNRLSAGFELVIMDLPPVSKSVIGPAMSKALDGVVLVVEAERTRTPVVLQTQKTIKGHGGTVLGVVLNKRRSHIPKFFSRST